MEKEGVGLAAVSYDSTETLRSFAEKYKIGFPLLSDKDSAVIRRFGIFNFNIAPGLRSYGVPHPVEYMVAPDGVVVRKYFVPNYQHRVTGAAVVLREFGAMGGDVPAVTVRSGALTVEIKLSSVKAFPGQELGYLAKFVVEPGWHVYGATAQTPTSVTFEDPKIIRQSFELPAGEAYSGAFQGSGLLLLKFPLDPGSVTLAGIVRFQLCSDSVCEAPESVPFELAITLRASVVATPGS